MRGLLVECDHLAGPYYDNATNACHGHEAMAHLHGVVSSAHKKLAIHILIGAT